MVRTGRQSTPNVRPRVQKNLAASPRMPCVYPDRRYCSVVLPQLTRRMSLEVDDNRGRVDFRGRLRGEDVVALVDSPAWYPV